MIKCASGGYGTTTWTADQWKDKHVLIVDGKGIGQVRRVVGNMADTLTVDSAWATVPDNTSKIVVQGTNVNITVENNDVWDNGKTAISCYPCVNSNIKDNRVSQILNHSWDVAAIYLFSYADASGYNDPSKVWPSFNNIVEGNTVSNSTTPIGIRAVAFTNNYTYQFGAQSYNNVIRNNTVDIAQGKNEAEPWLLATNYQWNTNVPNVGVLVDAGSNMKV